MNLLIAFVPCFIPSLDTAATQHEVADNQEGPCGNDAQQRPLERGLASVPTIPHSSRQAQVPCGFYDSNGSLRAPMAQALAHCPVETQAVRLALAGSDQLD